MTKRAKPKQDANGKYLHNKATTKSKLNKSILNIGWGKIETYTKYKAAKLGKIVLKIVASYTSQECANCGYTHPDNRKTQAVFSCGCCGNVDNADKNAALVIKKRAIDLIKNTGTVLHDGVLKSCKGQSLNDSKSNSCNAIARSCLTVKKEKLLNQSNLETLCL